MQRRSLRYPPPSCRWSADACIAASDVCSNAARHPLSPGRGSCEPCIAGLKFAHRHTDESSGTTCGLFILYRAHLRKRE
jgi:hypothetical protein